MADYTVTRVEADPNGTIVPTCAFGQVGYKYTIRDKVTGVEHVETMCISALEADPCHALRILTTRGYVPNDWTTECP